MVYNYCTLFDSLYLTRALAMYESLKHNCTNYRLYIFPFDDLSERLLKELDLECVTIIPLAELEDENLLKVKPTRTKGEYCWTCTPATILYCIQNFNLDQCTYIDADLYFFADPNVLVDEMGDNSVLITEHRYSQRYNQALKRGIYCVQFITFKNTADGLLALNWWSGKCLEWCYSRLEDGKFGDQKYLDDWPVRFKGVHVLKHLGGGVAPWNIQRYTLYNHKNRVSVYEGNDSADLIFYHFHYVKFYKNDQMDLGNYKFSKEVKTILYQRYISHISQIEATLLNEFQFGRVVQGYFYKSKLLIPLHRLARIILGIYNIEIVADFKDGKFN